MSNVNATVEEKYKLVADTIRSYPLQLQDSWESVLKSDIPKEYNEVSNIILCGMGGSALGGRIVKSVTTTRLRIPFEISNDYKLPNYANSKSLVIVSSYSGTTEETISCIYEAIDKGCRIFGITAGGKLSEIMTENNIPCYIIDEKNNPSKQPRMSIGYSTGAILALFTKLGFVHILNEEIEDAISTMHKLATEFHEHAPETSNLAKRFSSKLRDRAITFVSSEHLVGSTHTVKNQFNESAKTYSTMLELPELNHHFLEGLARPLKIKQPMVFLFFESDLYADKIRKRYPITEDVVKKCGFEHFVYKARSAKKLSQAFEIVMLGSYMTYFLSSFYKIDPLIIPWVDYFKDQMSKNSH